MSRCPVEVGTSEWSSLWNLKKVPSKRHRSVHPTSFTVTFQSPLFLHRTTNNQPQPPRNLLIRVTIMTRKLRLTQSSSLVIPSGTPSSVITIHKSKQIFLLAFAFFPHLTHSPSTLSFSSFSIGFTLPFLNMSKRPCTSAICDFNNRMLEWSSSIDRLAVREASRARRRWSCVLAVVIAVLREVIWVSRAESCSVERASVGSWSAW